jgi:hypothetical protein
MYVNIYINMNIYIHVYVQTNPLKRIYIGEIIQGEITIVGILTGIIIPLKQKIIIDVRSSERKVR